MKKPSEPFLFRKSRNAWYDFCHRISVGCIGTALVFLITGHM